MNQRQTRNFEKKIRKEVITFFEERGLHPRDPDLPKHFGGDKEAMINGCAKLAVLGASKVHFFPYIASSAFNAYMEAAMNDGVLSEDEVKKFATKMADWVVEQWPTFFDRFSDGVNLRLGEKKTRRHVSFSLALSCAVEGFAVDTIHELTEMMDGEWKNIVHYKHLSDLFYDLQEQRSKNGHADPYAEEFMWLMDDDCHADYMSDVISMAFYHTYDVLGYKREAEEHV